MREVISIILICVLLVGANCTFNKDNYNIARDNLPTMLIESNMNRTNTIYSTEVRKIYQQQYEALFKCAVLMTGGNKRDAVAAWKDAKEFRDDVTKRMQAESNVYDITRTLEILQSADSTPIKQ